MSQTIDISGINEWGIPKPPTRIYKKFRSFHRHLKFKKTVMSDILAYEGSGYRFIFYHNMGTPTIHINAGSAPKGDITSKIDALAFVIVRDHLQVGVGRLEDDNVMLFPQKIMHGDRLLVISRQTNYNFRGPFFVYRNGNVSNYYEGFRYKFLADMRRIKKV